MQPSVGCARAFHVRPSIMVEPSVQDRSSQIATSAQFTIGTNSPPQGLGEGGRDSNCRYGQKPMGRSATQPSVQPCADAHETPYTRIAEHLHLAPSSGNSLEAWTSYTVKLFISTNGSRRPHFTAAAGSEPATSRSDKGYCAKNERAPREQHISLEHLC